MFLASDNTGPAHPQVMEHVLRANSGFAMSYGADPETAEVKAQIRETNATAPSSTPAAPS